MNLFEDYARRGECQDEVEALKRITRAYISQCGISLGCRTVLYVAGEAWMERLAWMDLPLSEKARKLPLVELMPYITDEYIPEQYDKYDITGMSDEELLAGCREIIREKLFDDRTNEALCWGLLKATEEKKDLSLEVEAMATDGTQLKGILNEQRCAVTSLTMTSPYNGLVASVIELVRDARQFLVDLYEDYNRLRNMENEVLALYPKYQEELRKHKNDSSWKKACVFDDVYGDLIGNTVLLFPRKLFQEWFGLEFYDSLYRVDPTWL